MEILHRLVSFLSWHRRAVAACCAAAAVWGVVAIAQSPPPAGERVVALAEPVAAGAAITREQVRLVEVPADVVTDTMARDVDEVSGTRAAVPLERGQLVASPLLLRDGVAPKGKGLVPIAVPDSELRAMLRPGAQVRLVVALDAEPEVLARARVTSMGAEEGSPLGGTGTKGLVVVEVDGALAPQVATLGQSSQLSVVIEAA